MSLTVAPLRAEFFITESGRITERAQDLFQFIAIRNLSFNLDSGLMTGHLAPCFMGEQPFVSIFPQAQNVAAFLQGSAWEIVQSVPLVGPGGYLAEARSPQPSRESAKLVYTKLDLDFVVRWHQKAGFGLQAPDVGPQTSDLRLRTSDFGPQTSDLRLRTSDFGPQTSDLRLRTSDFCPRPLFDSQASCYPEVRSLTADA